MPGETWSPPTRSLWVGAWARHGSVRGGCCWVPEVTGPLLLLPPLLLQLPAAVEAPPLLLLLLLPLQPQTPLESVLVVLLPCPPQQAVRRSVNSWAISWVSSPPAAPASLT